MIRHIAILAYAGMNAREIADELGIYVGSVRDEMKRMHLWRDARGDEWRKSFGYRPEARP